MKKIIVTNGKEVIVRITISGKPSAVKALYESVNSDLFGISLTAEKIKSELTKEPPVTEAPASSVLTPDNSITNSENL